MEIPNTVQRIIDDIVQELMFQLGTKSYEEAKMHAKNILSQISTRENVEKFELFSKTLTTLLEQSSFVPASVKCHFTEQESLVKKPKAFYSMQVKPMNCDMLQDTFHLA